MDMFDLYMIEDDEYYYKLKILGKTKKQIENDKYIDNLIEICYLQKGCCENCKSKTICVNIFRNSNPWFKRFVTSKSLSEIKEMSKNYETI